MSGRLASDREVEEWQEDGWVLLDGLVGTDEIDAATPDLETMFPSASAFHADPSGETERWLGRPAPSRDLFVWPPEGPGFRPEQHLWKAEFPFSGSGALNRLCVHPAIVDFAERALGTADLRIYQVGASAKYAGAANYEQPMHTDRNHSWLPAGTAPPWWNLTVFLYLSDVEAGNAPTRLVGLDASGARATTVWGVMPNQDPDLYAAERPAPGPRGSLLAYRSNVFHRGANLTEASAARFLMGVAFKVSGLDWIGFSGIQSRSTELEWVSFVEGLSPRQLALFGFPEPGHQIWTDTLLDQTADRYPKLDLTPWRSALASR
jgi:hypothetical protein